MYTGLRGLGSCLRGTTCLRYSIKNIVVFQICEVFRMVLLQNCVSIRDCMLLGLKSRPNKYIKTNKRKNMYSEIRKTKHQIMEFDLLNFLPMYPFCNIWIIEMFKIILINLKKVLMTDHAGPRRRECPPGTKLWRPPAFLTQFRHPRSSFDARFRFHKTNIKIIRRGKV